MSASGAEVTEASVLAAADAIVRAFGAHDVARYFSLFDASASFVFYTADERLNSRAEYEALWHSWEADDGFRVHGCVSSDQLVQVFGDTAVFTHSVESRVEFGGEVSTLHERETIVFALRDGELVAVHEHLSPAEHSA